MPAITNSRNSRASSTRRRGKKSASASQAGGGAGALVLLALVLSALSAAAIWFTYSRGWTLYYGDAAAHLNIARRVIDSRDPGWGQVGTVWLPLPHLLMLPLVWVDGLWRSGLAGAIPAALCFVLAGCFLFLATRRAFGDVYAATCAALVLALNPNLLYLQSTPMTEPVFLAAVAALLYFTLRFRDTQSWRSLLAAAAATSAATMTRYEGWFLAPFAALYILAAAKDQRVKKAVVFAGLAALVPALWLVHNYAYYGNALAFYNGPSSAKAIYQRALDAGMARYPGDGEWKKALLYVRAAVALCAGMPLVWIGRAGFIAALLKRRFWPAALLALMPLFYVWSLHSGGTPIFVPHLWPNAWYNTRYGLAALPLLAFGAGALVALAPAKLRPFAAVVVVAAAVAPWLAYPRPEAWICCKESQVNSEARRAWTRETAAYLQANYHRGEGILTTFGDLAGIYQQAGIPLRETHNDCSRSWRRLTESAHPEIREKWAVAFSGDAVARTISRVRSTGARYDLVKTITVKGAPVVEVYRRQP